MSVATDETVVRMDREDNGRMTTDAPTNNDEETRFDRVRTSNSTVVFHPVSNISPNDNNKGELRMEQSNNMAPFEASKRSGTSSLEGHRYIVSEAPSVPAAFTGDTPDVWFHQHQEQLKTEAGAKEEERLRALKQKKEDSKGGAGYKIGKLFSNATATVTKSVGEAKDSLDVNVRDANIKQAKARLQKYFPNQVGGEGHFIFEFDCDAIHSNRPVKGHVLITRSHLLFVGKGSSGLLVLEEIPLADIVSYAKGVSVPCNDKEMRWVLDIPNSHIKADAVQIFTKKSMHFNFLNISHSITNFADGHPSEKVYERFLNYFDHAWRAAK